MYISVVHTCTYLIYTTDREGRDGVKGLLSILLFSLTSGQGKIWRVDYLFKLLIRKDENIYLPTRPGVGHFPPHRKNLHRIEDVAFDGTIMYVITIGGECAEPKPIHNYLQVWDGFVYASDIQSRVRNSQKLI